jgi:uncharacterized protein
MSIATKRLGFPFAVDAESGRLAQETNYDAYIRQLIRQVLFTGEGERINRPDFGAGVKRLVFAPSSVATASLAETLVFQALSTWLGTLVRTDQVKVKAGTERLEISIEYTVLARGEQRFLNLEVAG